MDAIRNWLKQPVNYDTGAKLYLMYGKDNALRRIFSEPVSEFKKRKLVEALKGLLVDKVAVEKKIEETKAVAIQHIAVSDRQWPDKLDATLKALKAQWKPLYAELMHLCTTIYDVAKAGETDLVKKAEAGAMAHRICDLDDECDTIYQQRDFYLKHGKIQEEEKPIELVCDAKRIPKALANAERYVRDYKNKLKKQPDNVHAAEQLKKWEWAVSEYKKKLNLE
jgi:hypothetical protein